MPERQSAAVPIAEREGALLLALARRAVTVYLSERRRVDPPRDEPWLEEHRGVFVTLKQEGDLRGCIGYPLPVKPLGEAVVECAISAAVNDPRFPPVRREEVEGLRVEVSVLSAPESCRPEQVEVGRHGLIVGKGNRRGLLLPQVATEYGWDRDTFLDHTCLKAGLDRGAWRQEGVRLECFTAQVFGEER